MKKYLDKTGLSRFWSKIKNLYILGNVLYENENGSNEIITLSESSANYNKIEIYYRNNDNFYCSVKIDNPNGKKVDLFSFHVSTNNYVLKFKAININEATLTPISFWEGNLNGFYSNGDNVYITKVVGYKN